jgi:hypothetical protein
MLLAWLSAVVCLVLLVGTVTGWYWLEVYHQSAESRIESQARRTAQALILPSGLAISAAAGVVVVSRVGARGTGVRLVQGEFTYTLPESVLLGAAVRSLGVWPRNRSQNLLIDRRRLTCLLAPVLEVVVGVVEALLVVRHRVGDALAEVVFVHAVAVRLHRRT